VSSHGEGLRKQHKSCSTANVKVIQAGLGEVKFFITQKINTRNRLTACLLHVVNI